MYFLLLVLGILLNLGLNTDHKQNRFFKTLAEKSLEFILSRRGGTIAFDLSLVLLLAEINLIAKEQSCKRNALRTYGTSHVEMILALLIKVIALYL